MKNFLTVLAITVLALPALAQGPDEYWLGLEEHAVHSDGDLAGMTTWRLYLNVLHENDFLSACSGSEENPWVLESTSTPAWYNVPDISETFASAINPAFFSAFPELEYDSWLTIGASSSEDGIDISSVSDPFYNAFDTFEAGENVNSNTMIGNLWFTLFDPNDIGSSGAAFGGADLKILVAQITTSGTLSGSIYFQIFPEGIQDPDVRLLLPIVYAPTQCTDDVACNYNPSSWLNDDCVYGPSTGVIVGESEVIVQTGQTEWTYTCDPGADSYLWDTGNGTSILSGQGTNSVTIDWGEDILPGTDLTVIAYNSDDCAGAETSIHIEFSVGLGELDFSSHLSVFPCPANSIVTVNLESDLNFGTVECEIRSISGQLVEIFEVSNGYKYLDVSSFANGTYMLSLQTERGIVRQSLIVAH